MPRMMSFALTTKQFLNESKHVTRRQGWWFLKPGDIVMGVEKAMGLKRGEKVKKLGPILILSCSKEPVHFVDPKEVVLEGFPDLSPVEFVEMYCTHNRCFPDSCCNRIAYEYLCDCDCDPDETLGLDGTICFLCGRTIKAF
jgi:hypothetical protein